MSIHSRPRNPYRVIQFAKNLRARRRFWFQPKAIFNKHNFWSCWHSADEHHFDRWKVDNEDWCPEPGCWGDRDHEGDHIGMLSEDIFAVDEPVEKL